MQAPRSPVDVRARILEEATRLFSEQGFGSTSVRELVEAAGVTKPTLYYYFENKDALLREIVQTSMAGLHAFVEEIATSGGSVRDRLVRFSRGYIEGGLENPHVVKLLMTLSHRGIDAPDIDVITIHTGTIVRLKALLQEGIDCGELRADLDIQAAVMTFLGTANLYLAACLQDIVCPDQHSPADPLIDIFFHGVAAR